jgi:hypothetical protein
MLIGLSACGSLRADFAFLTQGLGVSAPKPADGLWAILDPGCPKPAASNIKAWPACASPFWIKRDKAVLVRTNGTRIGPHEGSFAADYTFALGDPLIAQVGTHKDGYMFLALTQLSRDPQGRLVGAVGAAVACPQATGGTLVIKPILNGCDNESLEGVRKAAVTTLQDRAALQQVAWIAPGSP